MNLGAAKDFGLNILSAISLTAVVQLLVYPGISRVMPLHQYGLVLTGLGLVNALAVAFGASLNNSRLVTETKYEEGGVRGDFNILFAFLAAICALACAAAAHVLHLTPVWVFAVISLLTLTRTWLSVQYRLVINYRRTLVLSLVCTAGYAAGLVATLQLSGAWWIPFVVGEAVGCAYLWFTTHLLREPWRRTPLWPSTFRVWSAVMVSALLGNLVTYADRFILLPSAGAMAVTEFTVASFLGKTASLVLMPVSGVMLSYYARESSLDRRSYYYSLALYGAVAVGVYALLLAVGRPLTGLLYPTAIESAAPVLNLASGAALVFTLGSALQPALMKFAPNYWQAVIQATFVAGYAVIGAVVAQHSGVAGFCWVLLVLATLRAIATIVVTVRFGTERRVHGD